MGDRPDPIAAFADAPPEAVTFDFWDTLVRTDMVGQRAVRRAALVAALERHGHPVDGDLLDDALGESVRQFNESWHANHQFTGEQGAEVLVAELGVHVGSELAGDLATAFVRSGADHPFELTDGVAEAIGSLTDAGVRIGIVCDVGMTPSDVLRGHLERHGVLERFDHWSFSDEVGAYKPDPAIFGHALHGLAVREPARVAHVGDLVRTDVAGARAAGLVAIRYAGANDDPAATVESGPEGESVAHLERPHAVVHDHRDLPGVLGLG